MKRSLSSSALNAGRRYGDDLFASLPDEWPEDLLPEIQRRVKASGRKVVVLDDDPTGTQTVHDVSVLTRWTVADLVDELRNDLPACYLLTNSRSLPLTEAQDLNADIGRNLVEAARQVGRQFAVVSRSDSTLRGHFPGEVDALAESLGGDFDAWLIIPFFLEGGRYTVDDIHYVAEGDCLVPVSETEFAQDATLGFRASNLRRWVEEKTSGRVPRAEVHSISIHDLRQGGPERVLERLLDLSNRDLCVVNAVSYRDLEVVTRGLLNAEAQGKSFLYRTAASFVRVRCGLKPRPLLRQGDLELPARGGGLFVVGSHVPRTTAQVDALLSQTEVTGIEISVEALLTEGRRQAETERVANQADRALRRDEDVALYTTRRVVTAEETEDAERNLSIGRRISAGVVAILRMISHRPRYLLAKGGITSSDVATGALGVKRAWVRGQILPGVPLWQLGRASRYPGLAYIVFPGNVGSPDALVRVVRLLDV